MTNSRRAFLRNLPALGALPAAWATFARVLEATPGPPAPANEAYWSIVKREFPLEDGLIYLNAANVCPSSRPVMDRHLEYLRDFHANPSFQNRDKYEPQRERLRKKLAALFRVAPEEIAVTRNTSEGNNLVVRGIDLKAGDEILILDQNHPSNRDSWQVRARREGLVVRSVTVPVPARTREELLDGVEKALTPRTRVVSVTHVTNTAGIQYPVKAIGELARRRGAWMHVDGAQTFGALDVDLKDMGSDSYATSAHKWAMGPLEAGVLYVRAERIPELWPSIVTAGWSDRLKGARKFEILGQQDDPRIVAFEAAVDFLNLIGISDVEARVRALATLLKTKLREIPGVELKTNMEPELSGGVVRFHLPKVETKRLYDALWTRHRVSGAMNASGSYQGIRLCPHIYNSPEEIEMAAAAVREPAS